MSNTRTLSKVIGTTVLAVTLLALSASFAFANHSWGKYHWGLSTQDTTTNPLQIGDNLTTADWQARLGATATDWDTSVLKNQVIAGTSNSNCDPTLGRIEVCNGEYGSTGWLGIAQVWAYRGKDSHIAQAVTLLNDTYFNTSGYNSSAWRNMVMCQEVGHTFGLDHQDENFANANLGTCMDYTNDPEGTNGNLNNETPNTHDYAMLEEVYAHHNQTTSGGGNTGGGSGKGRNKNMSDLETTISPASWGQAVAQDAQGKNSLYVRNLDNGMQLITHVFWTPDTSETQHTNH